MAPSPKKIAEYKSQPATIVPPKSPKKVSNCFSLNEPYATGMVPVSTDKVNKDGCFVMIWQPQKVTMMVSDASEWYSYASKILKANLVFSFVFAFVLLVVLVVKRDRF